MPEQPSSNLSQDEKLNLLLWHQIQQAKTLQEIQESILTVSSEQADFNSDLAALGTFLTNLGPQLTAIQTELADQGITNVTGLDALVTQANQLEPTITSLAAGNTSTTPPDSSGPSPSGTTPSAA